MSSVAIIFLVFCVAPMLLIAFGYWLGRGMPGSPIVIVRRENMAAPRRVMREEIE